MSGLQVETHRAGAGWRVQIAGAIDEGADLEPLETLAGPVEIDMRGIRRINWAGTRRWLGLMDRLRGRMQLVLVGCPPAVVRRLNMVRGFLGGGTVATFYAPMTCARCCREYQHLFVAAECRALGGLPELACSACGGITQLDVEDRYLRFLGVQTQRVPKLVELLRPAQPFS